MGKSAYMGRLTLGMILASVGRAAGQIFDLGRVGEVHANAISVQHVYYAHAGDGTQSGATVTVKAAAVSDMKAKAPARPSLVEAYKDCYIVFVPAHVYDLIVDPATFCGHMLSREASLQHVVTFQVAAQHASGTRSAKLQKSGVYYLGIANCGTMSGFKLDGSVTVAHAHGYLPALHVHMTTLYMGCTAAYIMISLLWACVLVSKWSMARSLHWHFMAVTITAAIECLVWLMFYTQWNSGGAENEFLLIAGSFASTWKVLVIFRMAFSAKFSPGQADAGMWDGEAVNLALIVWSLLAFDLCFAHYRSIKTFADVHIVLHALPAIIVTGVMVMWAEKSMADEVSSLKQVGYDAHVSNLLKSQAILGLAAAAALIASLVHVFDPTLAYDANSWSNHAMTSDGLSQLVFAMALVSAMLVWTPSEELEGKEYRPQHVSNGADVEVVGAVFDDSCLEDVPGPAE